jgi:hypothetical protein
MKDSDLDFLIPVSLLEATYTPRLAELGKDVWARQAEALFAKAYREQSLDEQLDCDSD